MGAHDDYLDPDRWLWPAGEMPVECDGCGEELPDDDDFIVAVNEEYGSQAICAQCAGEELETTRSENDRLRAQLAKARALLVDVRLHEDGDLSAIRSAAEWIKRRDALLQALAGGGDQ